jgi:hypothetical protein
MPGGTYHKPIGGGYTENHPNFDDDNQRWAGKASAAANVRNSASIRVQLATFIPGKSRMRMIGVIIWHSQAST